MIRFLLALASLLFLSNCDLPDTLGFYQPITFRVDVPDGPPEYKAGWYSGCKSGMANKRFGNSFVYQENRGPDFSSGVYDHDPKFQIGWGQGWFACVNYMDTFITYNAMKYGPLSKQ